MKLVILLFLSTMIYLLTKNQKKNMLNNLSAKDWFDFAKYPREFKKELERAVRHETRHFESGQWLDCRAPGMESAGGKTMDFPFGWSSLLEYCQLKGLDKKHFSLVIWRDNHTKKLRNFIVFPSEYYGIDFMAWFIINKRKGNISLWNSLDPETSAKYRRDYNKIKNRWVI